MDDTKIIDLFWARSEDAIVQTDVLYGRKLNALANNILLNREDGEESVNDTYMQTWDSIPPHRPKYFFAFLASICRHLSLNKLDWNMAAKRNAVVVSLTEEMELCIPDTSHERTIEAINLISLQGFMGTDSYAAFQEWQNFLSAYDPDHSILNANNDFLKPDAYFSYSCYSQDMIDKIDEICEKYHLQPLGKPWFFDRGEDVFDTVGIESVFSEKARTGVGSVSGYCYANGTFDIEGTLELNGQWSELVSYGFRSVQKTSFDGVPRNIGDVKKKGCLFLEN